MWALKGEPIRTPFLSNRKLLGSLHAALWCKKVYHIAYKLGKHWAEYSHPIGTGNLSLQETTRVIAPGQSSCANKGAPESGTYLPVPDYNKKINILALELLSVWVCI